LLAPLQLQDGAAAAVCSRWADDGWKATSEGRRHVTRVAFDFPQYLLGTDSLNMAVIPGGDEQLAVGSGFEVRILARDMSSGASFEVPTSYGDFAASEQFPYMITDDRLCSLTHDGTEVASYEDQKKPTNGTHAPHPCQEPHPTAPATSLRQSHRLRRPSTTAVFPRASSPRSTTTLPTSFPPSTPPALSPSGHTQIDHATVPAHTHLSCVPPVCDTSDSLLWG